MQYDLGYVDGEEKTLQRLPPIPSGQEYYRLKLINGGKPGP